MMKWMQGKVKKEPEPEPEASGKFQKTAKLMTKSHNIAAKTEQLQAPDKPEEEKARAIQIVVAEKPTNLSTNSAELNLPNRFNLHSLERIRQESGGS